MLNRTKVWQSGNLSRAKLTVGIDKSKSNIGWRAIGIRSTGPLVDPLAGSNCEVRAFYVPAVVRPRLLGDEHIDGDLSPVADSEIRSPVIIKSAHKTPHLGARRRWDADQNQQ